MAWQRARNNNPTSPPDGALSRRFNRYCFRRLILIVLSYEGQVSAVPDNLQPRCLALLASFFLGVRIALY